MESDSCITSSEGCLSRWRAKRRAERLPTPGREESASTADASVIDGSSMCFLCLNLQRYDFFSYFCILNCNEPDVAGR